MFLAVFPTCGSKISMLRKFNNRSPEKDAFSESRRGSIRGNAVKTILILAAIIAGIAAYVSRDYLRQVYSRIAMEMHTSFEKYSQGAADQSFFERIRDIWSDSKIPPASPSSPEPQERPEDFLYTVELLDGGKIEGKAVEVGGETVTMTDEKGLEIRVDKAKVAGIKKIRL